MRLSIQSVGAGHRSTSYWPSYVDPAVLFSHRSYEMRATGGQNPLREVLTPVDGYGSPQAVGRSERGNLRFS